MRAWRADVFGPPREVLTLREMDVPTPPPNCVTVRVSAAGVGLPDLFMTQGRYPLIPSPPVSPGQEMVGEVVALGEGSRFSLGDRVMGLTLYTQGWGSFAEYCLMEDHRGCVAPDALSDEEAAGFVIPFKTAFGTLVTRGGLQAGETLLVLGAAGGSGSAAIQIGKRLGATVIAVASGGKLDFCKAMGADFVIDYKDGDFTDRVNALTKHRGVDVVFDPVGGATSEQTARCIARHGRICLVGFASGSWPHFDPLDMVLKNFSVVGCFVRDLSPAQDVDPTQHGLLSIQSQAAFQAISALAETGALRPTVGRVVEFEDAITALALLEQGPPPGKMVVKIGGRTLRRI